MRLADIARSVGGGAGAAGSMIGKLGFNIGSAFMSGYGVSANYKRILPQSVDPEPLEDTVIDVPVRDADLIEGDMVDAMSSLITNIESSINRLIASESNLLKIDKTITRQATRQRTEAVHEGTIATAPGRSTRAAQAQAIRGSGDNQRRRGGFARMVAGIAAVAGMMLFGRGEGDASSTPQSTPPAEPPEPQSPPSMPVETPSESVSNAHTQPSQYIGESATGSPALSPDTARDITRTSGNADVRPLLDFIARYESRGNYNAVYGSAEGVGVDFTRMTVRDVLAWQDRFVANGSRSSAIGRYQFIRQTLRPLAERTGTMDALFSPQLQDEFAIDLLEEKGLRAFQDGNLSANEFLNGVADVWSSIPRTTGISAHQGILNNRALTSVPESMSVLGEILDHTSATVATQREILEARQPQGSQSSGGQTQSSAPTANRGSSGGSDNATGVDDIRRTLTP